MTSAAPVGAAAPAASSVPPALVWHHSTPLQPLAAAPLQPLLSATQPEQVERILRTVFRARNEGVTAERRNTIAAEFSIDIAETDAVSHAALLHCTACMLLIHLQAPLADMRRLCTALAVSVLPLLSSVSCCALCLSCCTRSCSRARTRRRRWPHSSPPTCTAVCALC